jgi:hypothetical protein
VFVEASVSEFINKLYESFELDLLSDQWLILHW